MSVSELEEMLKSYKGQPQTVEKIVHSLEQKKTKGIQGIYLEAGKYYCASNNNAKAIENFKKYVKLGGNNEEVMLLLAKLLRQEKRFDEALHIAELINDITEDILREKIYLYTSSNKPSSAIIPKMNKLLYAIEKQCSREFLSEVIFIIFNKKISKSAANAAEWATVIAQYMNVLSSSDYRQIVIGLALCYTNEYILRAQSDILLKLSALINAVKDTNIVKSILFNIIDAFNQHNYTAFTEVINMLEKIICKYPVELTDKIGEFYKQCGQIPLFVKYLCKCVEQDDANRHLVLKLGLVVRSWDYTYGDQKKILKILDEYAKSAKKLRAGNIFLNEIEIIRKKTTLKSKPRIIIASLTAYCNLKCVMCPQNKDRPYEIDKEHANYIKMIMPYLEEIRWLGGEVFLYKGFDEMLQLANKYGVYQEIITNGLLLDSKKLDLFVNNNINLTISLEAVDKELYEKIRVGGKFDDLINNLNAVKEYKKNVKNFSYVLSPVIMSLNYKQIDKLVDFALFYGFDKINFQKYTSYKFSKDFSLTAKQLNEVIIKIDKFKEKSLKNEIPITVESNIEPESDINVENELLMRISGDFNTPLSVLEAQYQEELKKRTQSENKTQNEEIFLEPSVMPAVKNELDYAAQEKPIEKLNDNAQAMKLFCMAPWTTLAFFDNKGIKFSCVSDHTTVSKVESMWNDKNVVAYRQKIVNNDYTCCNKVCHDSGTDGEKTRLGL